MVNFAEFTHPSPGASWTVEGASCASLFGFAASGYLFVIVLSFKVLPLALLRGISLNMGPSGQILACS